MEGDAEAALRKKKLEEAREESELAEPAISDDDAKVLA